MIDLIKKIIKDFIKDFDTSIMAADPEEEIDRFLDEWIPKQLPPKTIFKITDPAKLEELWDELQQKLINDPKFIPLISLPAPSKEKVFIATSGEWSNYSTDGVFSTKEKADEFCNNSQATSIEEWTLDIPKEFWYQTHIYMLKNGDIHQVFTDNLKLEHNKSLQEMTKPRFHFYDWKPIPVFYYVCSSDEKTAIKKANEMRGFILANNLWGKEEEVREHFKLN